MAYNTLEHASLWTANILTGLMASPLLSDGVTLNLDLEQTPGETIYPTTWSSFTVTNDTNCPTPGTAKTTSDVTQNKYPVTPSTYFIKIGFCAKDMFAMRTNVRNGLLDRLRLDMILDFESRVGTSLTAAITTHTYGDTSSTITPEEFAAAKMYVQARSQGSDVIVGCSTALMAGLISQANIEMDPLLSGVTFIVSDQAFSNSANFIYPKNLFHYARLGGGIYFKEIADAGSGDDFTFLFHHFGLTALDEIDANAVKLITQDTAN